MMRQDSNVFPTLPFPRAILFDWDNTLVDSWGTVHHALARTFEAFGRQAWSLEEVKERVRYSGREAFPKLFGAKAEEAMALYYQSFAEIHLEQLAPLSGAEAFLRQAREELDIPLAVVSNKIGHLVRKETEHLGWQARFFAGVIGANDAARDKPSADPVLLALSGMKLPAGPDIWFIGDADVDVECARNSGCTAILIHETPSAKALSNGIQEDFHARDFDILSAFLRKLARKDHETL